MVLGLNVIACLFISSSSVFIYSIQNNNKIDATTKLEVDII